jgi:hypothetical protein
MDTTPHPAQRFAAEQSKEAARFTRANLVREKPCISGDFSRIPSAAQQESRRENPARYPTECRRRGQRYV